MDYRKLLTLISSETGNRVDFKFEGVMIKRRSEDRVRYPREFLFNVDFVIVIESTRSYCEI